MDADDVGWCFVHFISSVCSVKLDFNLASFYISIRARNGFTDSRDVFLDSEYHALDFGGRIAWDDDTCAMCG